VNISDVIVTVVGALSKMGASKSNLGMNTGLKRGTLSPFGYANPVLAESFIGSGKCRDDYTPHPFVADEEKVHAFTKVRGLWCIAYIIASLLITNLITGTTTGDTLIQNIVPERHWARKRELKCWNALKPDAPILSVKVKGILQWVISRVRPVAHRYDWNPSQTTRSPSLQWLDGIVGSHMRV